MIEVEANTPEFSLKDRNGKTVKLSSLKGKFVVFAKVYPTTQLPDFQDILSFLEKYTRVGDYFK